MAHKNTETAKAYQKRYHKEWYERNKSKRIKQITDRKKKIKLSSSEIINKIKLENGCVDCGYKEHSVALDFDHLSDKLYNVSSMVANGYTIEAIREEISKCEIVCANCHRVRTKSRR